MSIWVDFNDIGEDSTTVTSANEADPGTDLSVGASVTASDSEGNHCPATIVGRDGLNVVLKLDLDRFQDAPDAGPPVD